LEEKFEIDQSITKVSLMKTELVTTLKRKATQILKDVRESKEPVLITEHGLPSVYLVDAEDFERREEKLKLLEGLARGEAAFRDGRVVFHIEAKERMKRWLS
jgi:prevent-host-death family protein